MDRDVVLEGLSTVLGVPVSCGGGVQLSPNAVVGVGHFGGARGLSPYTTSSRLAVTQLSCTAFGYYPIGAAALASEVAHRQDFCVDKEEFFDPDYDFDFRDLTDSDSEYERGGESYKRPIGWNRIALKVWDKYEDGNAWLGAEGWRSESSEGEWPVAYHGTTFEGAKGIMQAGFKAGPRAVFGRGVYCTPDIDVAERDGYAQTFTSRKSGKTYKVALQSRINPQYRKVCDEENEYWLIPVPKGMSAKDERNIVDKAIRPYGILFKKIHKKE